MPAGDKVVRIVLSGRGIDEDFVDFVLERARRFSLRGTVALSADGVLTVTLAGPASLIDMMEVACMLGPVQCFVDDIARTDFAGETPDGPFQRLQEMGR